MDVNCVAFLKIEDLIRNLTRIIEIKRNDIEQRSEERICMGHQVELDEENVYKDLQILDSIEELFEASFETGVKNDSEYAASHDYSCGNSADLACDDLVIR